MIHDAIEEGTIFANNLLLLKRKRNNRGRHKWLDLLLAISLLAISLEFINEVGILHNIA